MEKVWLKQYQAGVPTEIDPDRYASINEMFEESCSQFQDRVAFVNMGQALSYKTLEEKSRAFAAYLQNILQLEKGDRVTLMMPNLLQYPVALFGILRAGLVVVNVNPLYTPRELAYQLEDSESSAIIVLANFAHTVEQVLAQGKVKIQQVIVTEVGDLFSFPKSLIVNGLVKYIQKKIPPWTIKNAIKFNAALTLGSKQLFEKPIVSGEDLAFLQYTGGTTGIPKGAMLTHRNMVANMEQAIVWIAPLIKSAEETIITALPLYHIFSLLANCLTFMRLGALNVLITNPRDMRAFVHTLSRYRFTVITGVNTLFNALVNQPAFAKLDFSALKLALGGGMSVQHAVATRWKALTGVVLLEAYGLTETSPAVCINPLSLSEFNGSIGLPISSTDISIRDESGAECGFNTAGELCVRGPQVMKGYWRKPEESKEALKEGWLKTGDIAQVNEQGFVQIVDRKKDMILISGFNVYPNEVEDVIALLPGVAEVAVVGVPTDRGEEVKAYIVRKDPDLTQEKIIAHCQTALAHYKIPKEIEFRSELPKTNVGKILRRALRSQNTEVH